MNKYWIGFLLGVFACVGVCGCSSTYIPISDSYRVKSTSWTIGDTGRRISLSGKSKGLFWTELWRSLPVSYVGTTWLLREDDLIFVGWSDPPKNSGDRRLLKSINASRPVDITEITLSNAVARNLLPAAARLSEDFKFDGIKRTELGVFVVISSMSSGAGFHGNILLPIIEPRQPVSGKERAEDVIPLDQAEGVMLPSGSSK